MIPFMGLWIALSFAMVAFNHSRKINVPQDALYLYQLNKIVQLKAADTVFIGDSSLGNAINAELWEKLSGQKTVNLALTEGFFGYIGGYMMLSNALLNGVKPKNVVLFFNPEQMWAPVVYDSFLQQSHFFWSENIPLYKILFMYWQGYMNKQALWFNLRKLVIPEVETRTSPRISNDYMAQNPSKREAGKYFGNINNSMKNIKLENLEYLKKIHELCTINNINCIYAHGTMVDRLYGRMEDYMPFVNRKISEVGFKIVKGTPIAPPSIDMGDTFMHVHPEVKDKYTRKYYLLVRPYLRRD